MATRNRCGELMIRRTYLGRQRSGHRNADARVCDSRMLRGAAIPTIRLTGRDVKPSLPDPKAPASKDDEVKALTLQEVLRIAVGVPLSAALAELTYRPPQQSTTESEH